MTTNLQDHAEVLVASWVLGGPDPDKPEYLPLEHPGLLDHALKAAMDEGAFPESWKKTLHFVEGRLRFTCVELEKILCIAAHASLTSLDLDRLRFEYQPALRSRGASLLIRREHPDLTVEQVTAWGKVLHQKVGDVRARLYEW